MIKLYVQVTKILRNTFATDDTAALASCRSRLQEVFDSLGDRIRNRPGRYLSGDTLGTEDLALAVAPLLLNSLSHCLSLSPSLSRSILLCQSWSP